MLRCPGMADMRETTAAQHFERSLGVAIAGHDSFVGGFLRELDAFANTVRGTGGFAVHYDRFLNGSQVAWVAGAETATDHRIPGGEFPNGEIVLIVDSIAHVIVDGRAGILAKGFVATEPASADGIQGGMSLSRSP